MSTVSRVGNRDVMRVRPFIRISGNLSMTTSDLSAKIPPFNAQRMLTDVGTSAPAASDDPNNPDAGRADAEVSFVTKDLGPILPKAKLAAVIAIDEIMLRVRDASNWRGNGTGNGPLCRTRQCNGRARAAGGLKLAYATEGTASDRMPVLKPASYPKTSPCCRRPRQITGGNPNGERVHVVKKGDTVTSILREQGATPEEAKSIAATLGARGRDGGLKEGQNCGS